VLGSFRHTSEVRGLVSYAKCREFESHCRNRGDEQKPQRLASGQGVYARWRDTPRHFPSRRMGRKLAVNEWPLAQGVRFSQEGPMRELYLWEEVEVNGEPGQVVEIHMSVPVMYLIKFPLRVYSNGVGYMRWYSREEITMLTESSG
jgi:hypothetical protein